MTSVGAEWQIKMTDFNWCLRGDRELYTKEHPSNQRILADTVVHESIRAAQMWL